MATSCSEDWGRPSRVRGKVGLAPSRCLQRGEGAAHSLSAEKSGSLVGNEQSIERE